MKWHRARAGEMMEMGMRAMVLERPGGPLRSVELEPPAAGAGSLLIRVEACGVCRTDLHLIDGELSRSAPADHPRP